MNTDRLLIKQVFELTQDTKCPATALDDIKTLLNQAYAVIPDPADSIAILWDVDDIIAHAEEGGWEKMPIETAREILAILDKCHDCNDGITWEHLGSVILITAEKWKQSIQAGQVICDNCGYLAHPVTADQGIGAFDYGGAKGRDVQIATLTDCCDAPCHTEVM